VSSDRNMFYLPGWQRAIALGDLHHRKQALFSPMPQGFHSVGGGVGLAALCPAALLLHSQCQFGIDYELPNLCILCAYSVIPCHGHHVTGISCGGGSARLEALWLGACNKLPTAAHSIILRGTAHLHGCCKPDTAAAAAETEGGRCQEGGMQPPPHCYTRHQSHGLYSGSSSSKQYNVRRREGFRGQEHRSATAMLCRQVATTCGWSRRVLSGRAR
jgi:hypothetical protein